MIPNDRRPADPTPRTESKAHRDHRPQQPTTAPHPQSTEIHGEHATKPNKPTHTTLFLGPNWCQSSRPKSTAGGFLCGLLNTAVTESEDSQWSADGSRAIITCCGALSGLPSHSSTCMTTGHVQFAPAMPLPPCRDLRKQFPSCISRIAPSPSP